ncbi:MAG: hypothetical protein HY547_00625 [Elusimicrobia bacterium]|nr:hypothetical protein [Elusimicrobiota bacterium]
MILAILLGFLVAFAFPGCPLLHAEPVPLGKIIDSYIEGTTTQMLVESNRMLDTSQIVYLHGGIALTIREVMSMKETEGVYYYKAYAPEKVRVLPGENIFLEITKKEEKLKRFEKEAIFMKKKYATVTFVEGEKAMINRGSLHNVDKRDVYKVFDSSGKAKGEIELYGVGDFLSAGIINYPIELQSSEIKIQTNDTAIFSGNRKLIGLGTLIVLPVGGGKGSEQGGVQITGGGNAWSIILKKGKIVEINLANLERIVSPPGIREIKTFYISPIWFRKAFFYPGFISPSVSIGLAYSINRVIPNDVTLTDKTGLAPMVGIGVETFTGKMIHARLDLQYYYSSRKYEGHTFKTDALFLLGGLTFNW